jgi:hypothetical protein
VQRLNDTHPGPASPEKLAGRCRTKADDDVAQSKRAASGVGVYDDLGRYRVCQAEIVRCGHAVDQHADLITTAQRFNHGTRIRGIGPLREFVESRLIVETAIDAAQPLCLGQSLERLVDGVTRSEIEEVGRRPDPAGCIGLNALQHRRFQV